MSGQSIGGWTDGSVGAGLTVRRYLVTFCAADHTGQLWLQGFNEVGLAIFGMSANELKALEARSISVVMGNG